MPVYNYNWPVRPGYIQPQGLQPSNNPTIYKTRTNDFYTEWCYDDASVSYIASNSGGTNFPLDSYTDFGVSGNVERTSTALIGDKVYFEYKFPIDVNCLEYVISPAYSLTRELAFVDEASTFTYRLQPVNNAQRYDTEFSPYSGSTFVAGRYGREIDESIYGSNAVCADIIKINGDYNYLNVSEGNKFADKVLKIPSSGINSLSCLFSMENITNWATQGDINKSIPNSIGYYPRISGGSGLSKHQALVRWLRSARVNLDFRQVHITSERNYNFGKVKYDFFDSKDSIDYSSRYTPMLGVDKFCGPYGGIDNFFSYNVIPYVSFDLPAGKEVVIVPELDGKRFWAKYMIRATELAPTYVATMNRRRDGSYSFIAPAGGISSATALRHIGPNAFGVDVWIEK